MYIIEVTELKASTVKEIYDFGVRIAFFDENKVDKLNVSSN